MLGLKLNHVSKRGPGGWEVADVLYGAKPLSERCNAGILLIEPLGANFSGSSIKLQQFSFRKVHLKMSSTKWQPFCLGLDVLRSTVHSKKYAHRSWPLDSCVNDSQMQCFSSFESLSPTIWSAQYHLNHYLPRVMYTKTAVDGHAVDFTQKHYA